MSSLALHAVLSNTFTARDGRKVAVSPAIASVIETLTNLSANAFCAIDGYKTADGKVSNYLVRAATGTESVYSSKMAELSALSFADLPAEKLAKWIPSKGKNSFASAEEQFNFCKSAMLTSMEKTLSGNRDDAHRQGHDRCSVQIRAGVTLDLLTEEGADGLKHPVQTNEGELLADKIRLHAVVMREEVLEEGERKVVNSGSKVLMDKVIESCLPSTKTALRTFSLDDGKFQAVRSGSFAL